MSVTEFIAFLISCGSRACLSVVQQETCREHTRPFRQGPRFALCSSVVDAPHLEPAKQKGRTGRQGRAAAACSRAGTTGPACTAVSSQRSTQALTSALNFGVDIQICLGTDSSSLSAVWGSVPATSPQLSQQQAQGSASASLHRRKVEGWWIISRLFPGTGSWFLPVISSMG